MLKVKKKHKFSLKFSKFPSNLKETGDNSFSFFVQCI